MKSLTRMHLHTDNDFFQTLREENEVICNRIKLTPSNAEQYNIAVKIKKAHNNWMTLEPLEAREKSEVPRMELNDYCLPKTPHHVVK